MAKDNINFNNASNLLAQLNNVAITRERDGNIKQAKLAGMAYISEQLNKTSKHGKVYEVYNATLLSEDVRNALHIKDNDNKQRLNYNKAQVLVQADSATLAQLNIVLNRASK